MNFMGEISYSTGTAAIFAHEHGANGQQQGVKGHSGPVCQMVNIGV